MSSNPPPRPTGGKPPVDKTAADKPAANKPVANKPVISKPVASAPAAGKAGSSKPAIKTAPGRRVPEAPGRRRAPKPSKVIVAGIAVGFVGSAACAVAPLLFRASSWWLALSLVLLIMSVVSWMALRE
jgi:MFS family permease